MTIGHAPSETKQLSICNIKMLGTVDSKSSKFYLHCQNYSGEKNDLKKNQRTRLGFQEVDLYLHLFPKYKATKAETPSHENHSRITRIKRKASITQQASTEIPGRKQVLIPSQVRRSPLPTNPQRHTKKKKKEQNIHHHETSKFGTWHIPRKEKKKKREVWLRLSSKEVVSTDEAITRSSKDGLAAVGGGHPVDRVAIRAGELQRDVSLVARKARPPEGRDAVDGGGPVPASQSQARAPVEDAGRGYGSGRDDGAQRVVDHLREKDIRKNEIRFLL